MGSGRAKIRRILEWRIWSRWREMNTQVFCEPTSFSCSDVEPTTPILLSGVFGHHAVSWDVALVSPFTK